jgi:hypothetical protein
MRVDALLYVSCEVRIGYRCVTQVRFKRFGDRNCFIERATRALRCPDDGDRTIILIDHHFGPFTNPFEDSVEVARRFRLGNVHLRHTPNHRSSPFFLRFGGFEDLLFFTFGQTRGNGGPRSFTRNNVSANLGASALEIRKTAVWKPLQTSRLHAIFISHSSKL